MSSQAQVPLVIYKLPLAQKKAIAATFLTAKFLSEVFNTVTNDPESLAFQNESNDALSEFVTSSLYHNGILSESKVNLILLKMLTVSKKAEEQ
jgi:hypothetical protein